MEDEKESGIDVDKMREGHKLPGQQGEIIAGGNDGLNTSTDFKDKLRLGVKEKC